MARGASSPQLVGREDAAAVLEYALTLASAGEPGMALVSGEAGVGKTRLVREFVVRAEGRGARVLWGECLPPADGDLPFAAFASAFRPLLTDGEVDALGADATELSVLLGSRAGAAGAAVTANSPTRLFEVIVGALGRLGRSTPVVLVVEDAHWADAATERLLGFLLRNLRDQRLLLVVTWRTDEPRLRGSLARLVAEVRADARVRPVDLGRLDIRDTAAQIAGILSAEPDTRLVQRVHVRGGGNPYFTEELVAAGAAAVPGAVRDVLLARIGALSATDPPRGLLEPPPPH
jgi:predicted ATPase